MKLNKHSVLHSVWIASCIWSSKIFSVVKVQESRGGRLRDYANFPISQSLLPHRCHRQQAKAKRLATADAGADGSEEERRIGDLEDAVELDAEEF